MCVAHTYADLGLGARGGRAPRPVPAAAVRTFLHVTRGVSGTQLHGRLLRAAGCMQAGLCLCLAMRTRRVRQRLLQRARVRADPWRRVHVGQRVVQLRSAAADQQRHSVSGSKQPVKARVILGWPSWEQLAVRAHVHICMRKL